MKDRTKNSIKPFWSWNDKLEKEELIRQIEQMKEKGIEGFFMHARAGLRTPYMSEEWFQMIEACLDKADELGMQAWAYDENGWPSGFADGLVTDLGLEHQQKSLQYLIWDGQEFPQEHMIATFRKTEDGFARSNALEKDALVFYYDVNPYYVDVFNKETIRYFLEFTHEKYYERFGERFGSSLQGFFTDEPQFCKSPWSFVFSEEFQNAYGYELEEHLPLLFFEEEGYEAVRNDFRCLVAKLFQESFIKQMYDWCTEHNCKLTGHVMGENTLSMQMDYTGGAMACYEYFHEPGIDHLRRRILSPLMPKQLGSVAAQLGKKTLTETFALCGWDVSLNELKWMAQWQYVNGVTSLCPHLEAYSLRGARKRDYPASLFTQLPWFEHVYSEFADYFTSLGALLDSGKDIAPLLVLHPIHSACILYNPFDRAKARGYNAEFEKLAQGLNDEHILYHYGDETILRRHGSVNVADAPFIQVGRCKYSAVLLPNLINLTKSTVDMLLAFAKAGGKLYAVGRLPEFENGRRTENIKALCAVVKRCNSLAELKMECASAATIDVYGENGSSAEVHITLKEMDVDKKLLYMTNNGKEEQTVTVDICGSYAVARYDVVKESEESLAVSTSNGRTIFTLDFAEYGSAVLMLYKSEDGFAAQEGRKPEGCYAVERKQIETITLKNKFDIVSRDDNAITLDKCTYRIDDGEWQSEIAVINLHNKVLELQRPCNVEMQFAFGIAEDIDFESINLCMEDPEKFEITINDAAYTFEDDGMFIDHAIRRSSIGTYLKAGLNRIRLRCYFTQSPELYYAKLTPGVHESILNKLTYDTELESIYLIGNFGVKMEEAYTLGERRCLYGGKTFSLTKPAEVVDITDITHQGFWFFSGQMSLSQKVNVEKEHDKRYAIQFEHLNAPATRVFVNGQFAGNMIFSPFELDVTELVSDGENGIVIQMLSGNRNLLGPHHKPEGESYSVGPDTFSDMRGWTDDPNLPTWTDNYNFVLFGADLTDEE
ncbi:MAG: hypothetical protein IJZ53_01010 [Tyzzerella sp.]|nr:hypothetical protein [Tyzzerella sp.]